MTYGASAKYPPKPARQAPLMTVPKVRLYVERPEEKNWFVHVGHVTERGRWRTEPHAHPAYGQVIFVRNGRGVMNLEGRRVPFEGPCALLVPTECVHGLDYELDVDRWVVTIELAYLTQVNAKLREFIALWALPRVIPLVDSADAGVAFCGLIQGLKREVESDAVGRVVGTEALLTTLLLMLVREAHVDEAGGENATRNDVRQVERFRKLIDEHFRENLTLQDYASMMAISLVQLRAACASAADQSPTKMIHARIITEAKRSLIFGDMSVEQIAFGLGFADAAYFTRFFRREVGQAPSQFRAAARQQTHHDVLSK
ncbi:helix-turn-helix domain-containing protein [Trinickia caryophylli]|uniref:AraC family transcriptional regulator, transcriptional activator of pobA n=1 Tax=Trinickia caryophylli TaxID=28094 RepID=A0A1X7E9D5_TRICW|nr:helix-turn-helix domain-containing protein [Trinickia caryophylli]PMS13003.1 AraC family transcriptional regulator [Trinickia caryophylli]TRX14764.1 helix-turn-helix domain-containing protein [Trinickia caryophylli]WQE14611.1 helix-turn-helix domain-containing protein [Trinickia caryophylli]SMF30014.1 AraC family transcriptional regulator, transcriptional activator of pobA [Trinickia caryophylli]GLU31974.1 AraC family transcriptional regulator [Trinickia caryophylli]